MPHTQPKKCHDRPHHKNAKKLLLALCLALVALSCASTPHTGRSQIILMSENEEVRQGLEYCNEIIAQEKIEEGTAR